MSGRVNKTSERDAGVASYTSNSYLSSELISCFDAAEQRASWRSVEKAVASPSKGYLALKRAFDVTSAGLGLVVLSPLLLGTVVAVRATSEGPAIFKQRRYGKDNVPFTCYKFRSMTVDTPSDVPTSLMNEDPSVMTPIGSFLRKTSIDELPQLVNIVRGDMSVVGPRPMILAEKEQIEEREKYDATSIRPGLTGWAQVNGRDAVSVEEKARLDGEYRSNMSPAMDAKILFKSVGVVLTRAGYSRGNKKRVPRCVSRPDAPTRLLVVSQHYWPEPFNFSDVCEGLVERGYEVTVLTGLPNYPEGDLYPDYRNGHNRVQERNGVHIIRAPLVPRGHNPIQRVINYYSFPACAKHKARELDFDFDVIVSLQSSPVMQSAPAVWIAEETGIPLLHYVIDIWPECLLAGGIKRGSAIYNHYEEVSKRIYSKADCLALTSPRFKSYLENMLGREIASFYLPQYAEDAFSETMSTVPPEGYELGKINLTFAGNVGSAQSVETLVCTAAILNNDDRFVFHVVGSGSELERCQKLASDLGAHNLRFHGRHDIEEMPAYYMASDAMLATFSDNPVLGLTLPRKIQSYMASGKPILAAMTGEARRVIEEAECGFCCDAEDAEGLAIACLKLACMSWEDRLVMGRSGLAYYQKYFSRGSFFDTLEAEIQKLKGTQHGE